jgi:putative DNA primase/helicase
LLKVVSIAPHPDFRRWVAAGGTRDNLLALYQAAPTFRPPSGAELIQRFEEIFKRYIVALKGVSLVVALYALMTHCFEIFSWIPYLSFSSPLESCGKSHAADIAGWASARPEILVSISEAALFRLITQQKPTVVVDEAEVLSGDGETAIALRAVLHAGCAPDDGIIRCAPKTHEVERFSPWCPKIFCAIGKLPRVLASRCIVVGMKRKAAGEGIKAFIRARVKAEVTKLGAEIAAWVSAHEAEIRAAYESFPDESFGDRSLENFAPLEALLTVADPRRLPELRQARLNLTRAGNTDLAEDSTGLLSDIRAIFEERGIDRISSADLVSALAAIETSPWAEWSHGKPISAPKLARLLKPFGIMPGTTRLHEGGTAKGYYLHDFMDAFNRYLAPSPGTSNRNNVTTRMNTGDSRDFGTVTAPSCVGSKNAQNLNKNAPCDGVTVSGGGVEDEL